LYRFSLQKYCKSVTCFNNFRCGCGSAAGRIRNFFWRIRNLLCRSASLLYLLFVPKTKIQYIKFSRKYRLPPEYPVRYFLSCIVKGYTVYGTVTVTVQLQYRYSSKLVNSFLCIMFLKSFSNLYCDVAALPVLFGSGYLPYYR
jgi:hypothetical protein